MKILIFTTDLIPLPGLPTSGTALRTFGLAQGLRAGGHDVSLSVPLTAIESFERTKSSADLPSGTRTQLNELRRTAFTFFNEGEIVAELNPDAVICGHWPAMMLRTKPSQALIIDLAGPHLLERHYQGSPDQESAILAKLAVIATADYFIVSGPSQRLYFLSFMMRAGVERPEERITTIPMPLSPELPQRRGRPSERFPRFVFGGVFLPWQDPSWGLTAVLRELERRQAGELTLIGGKHPSYNIKEGSYGKLFSELGKSERTSLLPMLPFERFVSELAECDVAVDLMNWNLERQLAVTIRSTTYLWAGLPVIYNDYADLGGLIRRYDAGWLVRPGDHDALNSVLEEIFSDPQAIAAKSQNAQKLAQAEFSWDKAVLPLLDFMDKPACSRLRETDAVVDYPDNTERRVYDRHALEQFFVSRVNGLAKVEFKLATHGIQDLAPLRLRLLDLGDARSAAPETGEFAQTTVAAQTQCSDLARWNNQWMAFEFEPIRHSAGRMFALCIESDDADAARSISPWSLRWSPYPMRGMRYAGKFFADEAICLRTTSTVLS